MTETTEEATTMDEMAIEAATTLAVVEEVCLSPYASIQSSLPLPPSSNLTSIRYQPIFSTILEV